MAQQLAIDTGSGNPPPNPAQYPSNAPEYVGGQTNPTTGAITPASQATADVAPPPQLPTTKLAKVAPKSSSLPATAGGYLGTAIGGEIGGQVGGGASLGAAAARSCHQKSVWASVSTLRAVSGRAVPRNISVTAWSMRALVSP